MAWSRRVVFVFSKNQEASVMAAGTLGLCIVVVVAAVSVISFGSAEDEVQVVSGGQCTGPYPSETPIKGNDFRGNVKIKSSDGKATMMGTLKLDKEWADVKVTGRMEKCKKSGDKLECEEDLVMSEYPGFCDNLKADKQVWSHWTQNFRDDKNNGSDILGDACPIKANTTYRLKKDSPVDIMYIFNDTTRPQKDWRFEVTYTSKNEAFGCLRYVFG